MLLEKINGILSFESMTKEYYYLYEREIEVAGMKSDN